MSIPSLIGKELFHVSEDVDRLVTTSLNECFLRREAAAVNMWLIQAVVQDGCDKWMLRAALVWVLKYTGRPQGRNLV